jgi:hypothetical protein
MSNHIDGRVSPHGTGIARGDPFQAQTYPVEDAVFEIDLNASRNILKLLLMIDLGEVDANLQCVG